MSNEFQVEILSICLIMSMIILLEHRSDPEEFVSNNFPDIANRKKNLLFSVHRVQFEIIQ